MEDNETKMKHYMDELKIMKEANDVYKSKIDHIYANNIIIAKERNGDEEGPGKSG